MGCRTYDRIEDGVKDVADWATFGGFGYLTDGEWGLQDEFDSLSGREASRNAMEAALQGNEEAARLLQEYYGMSREDFQSALGEYQQFRDGLGERYQPYTSVGNRATAVLADASGVGDGSSGFTSLLDLVRSSPDYQFAFDEGQRAIGANASAGGSGMGGSVLRELTRYGQDRATLGLGNMLQRLQGLSAQGLDATDAWTQREGNAVGNIANQYGQMGQQTGQHGVNLANLARNEGDIRSSGYTARYNAGRGFVEDAIDLGAQAYGAATGGI